MTIDQIGLLSKEVIILFGVIYLILITASIVTVYLKTTNIQKDFKELSSRIKSWWFIVTLGLMTIFLNKVIATLTIALISFLALREFISVIKLRHSDRIIIFLCYFAITIQFFLAYHNHFLGFIIFIPILMNLLIPFIAVLIGDTQGVTRSITLLQWSLMLTVFSLSHLAYLVNTPATEIGGAGAGGLLLYLVFLTQFNDVLQYLWGKKFGKHKILPKVSPNKTWEGFLGGLVTTTLLGYIFSFLTPYAPLQSLIMGLCIASSGFIGDVVISSVKRDFGLKDMGNLVPGHGGVMDRIDSLSYSSLVFFYLHYLFLL
jgi:phosphatidate cytidylyltransferase